MTLMALIFTDFSGGSGHRNALIIGKGLISLGLRV